MVRWSPIAIAGSKQASLTLEDSNCPPAKGAQGDVPPGSPLLEGMIGATQPSLGRGAGRPVLLKIACLPACTH